MRVGMAASYDTRCSLGYRARMMMLWFALAACPVPPDPAFQETTARDAYFRAWCRLYTDSFCVRDQLNQCEWDRSFDSRAACTNWMTFRVSQCPGANEMFSEQQAGVMDCVDQLSAFECGTDDFCVGLEGGLAADACEPITRFLTVTCVEESDG
jgi:hypothetical protein